MLQFASQLRDQSARLLAEHGVDGYKQRWRIEFPMPEYRRLEELIAGKASEIED